MRDVLYGAGAGFYTPNGRGWDHRTKCMSQEAAELSRYDLEAQLGRDVGPGGKRIRWRVSTCPICHNFYVRRDGSSKGDRAGQKRRRRDRREAANSV